MLTGGTEWLMSVAPAGLKLNEELDVFMGRAVLRILQVSRRVELCSFPQTTGRNRMYPQDLEEHRV